MLLTSAEMAKEKKRVCIYLSEVLNSEVKSMVKKWHNNKFATSRVEEYFVTTVFVP